MNEFHLIAGISWRMNRKQWMKEQAIPETFWSPWTSCPLELRMDKMDVGQC